MRDAILDICTQIASNGSIQTLLMELGEKLDIRDSAFEERIATSDKLIEYLEKNLREDTPKFLICLVSYLTTGVLYDIGNSLSLELQASLPVRQRFRVHGAREALEHQQVRLEYGIKSELERCVVEWIGNDCKDYIDGGDPHIANKLSYINSFMDIAAKSAKRVNVIQNVTQEQVRAVKVEEKATVQDLLGT